MTTTDASSEISQQSTECSKKENDLEVFPEEMTEAEFDLHAAKIIRLIEATIKFLSNAGCYVQNLITCHLEKLSTILDSMQRRNHSRSETVVSALRVLLETVQYWSLESYVLEFIQDRDIDYFLRHANALKMSFRVSFLRLPDYLLLLMLCHQKIDLKHFRTVLRYGVSPELRYQTTDFSQDLVSPTNSVVMQSILHFGEMLRDNLDDSADLTKNDVTKIGSLLVAAFPSLSGSCMWPQDVTEVLAEFFPELVGRAVPSLRHLCRSLIRQRLHANWALPYATKLLDLPLQVKAYLDLETCQP